MKPSHASWLAAAVSDVSVLPSAVPAVVKLCVMGLSCTENKLCQLSACPVMMLCLSTTVLRRGCLLCREETCILLPPPAAPEPSPCWFSALPVLGKGALMWLLSQRCQPWATRPPLPVGTGPGHSRKPRRCWQQGEPSRLSGHRYLQPRHTAEPHGSVPPPHPAL